MSRLCPNFKLWVYSTEDDGVFGDGKVKLLNAIDEQGSLREAAASLQISYRKAWGDLKKAEECLRVKLVEKSRGGAGGGKTALTPEGKRLITAYAKFRQEAEAHVARAFDEFVKEIEHGKRGAR
jgi:molybdate transport system regulatory protein